MPHEDRATPDVGVKAPGERAWFDCGGVVLLDERDWTERPDGENRRVAIGGIDLAVVAEGDGIWRVVGRRLSSAQLAGRPSVRRARRGDVPVRRAW